MKTPPYLVGVALLFWGWHVGLLGYAAVMALIIEAVRWVPWRLQVAEKDFNRTTDFTSVGFVVVIIYQFDTYAFHAIYAILELLPLVLFVLFAVQLYSTEGGVRLSTLFLSVRRAVARGQVTDNRTIDLSYPYLIVCLVAASAGEMRSRWFIVGAFLIVAVALFWHRPKERSGGLAAGLLVLAMAAGYFGHTGVTKLRWMLEPTLLAWFQDAVWANRNPFRGHTAIGAIGTLKLSERIVLRVKPDSDGSYPTLLREAVYQTFNRNMWLARGGTFEDQEATNEGTVWPLHAGKSPAKKVAISAYLRRGKGLISVPSGAFRIEQLGVEDLALNPFGVLQTNRGPGLVNYVVRYNPEISFDGLPVTHDLHVPPYYQDLFDGVITALGLDGMEPRLAVSAVRSFFDEQFRYSLTLTGGENTTPLRSFLTESRAGHCEYFASATVLLLRALKIPARYATGYSVQEYSALENSFVVRRRHAHSWARVYVDGRWVDVDTTPAVWAELEAEQAPWWGSLYDLWSWSGFQFSRWRWSEADEDESNSYLGWLILPLVIILGWRLSRQNRVLRQPVHADAGGFQRSTNSAFYEIANHLTDVGLERRRGETTRQWLTRWANAGQLPGAQELLGEIVALHYRCRFDPAGLDIALSNRFRACIRRWLALHRPPAT